MPLEMDAAYICPSCSESQWVGVDPSAGKRQQFVEDCPVCCRPILFTAVIDREGDATIESAEPE